MFKNLLEEFHSLLKSDGLQTQTEKLKSSNKSLIVLIMFLVTLSANATDYYVSNSGNDSNSGTSADQAWKTLNKVNSFTPAPGDKILFNRGDEWVGTIKVNASGRLGSNIVYGAYGTGEKPKIYGSEVVTGTWSVYSGNIYSMPHSGTVNQVFEDGVELKAARFPNTGYADITTKSSSTNITVSTLPNIDHTGSMVYIRTAPWSLETVTVTNSTNSNTTLSLSSAAVYDYYVKAGMGLFLTDNLEYIDQAGEWYHDGNTLYVWTPDGTSPTDNTVRVSTIDNVIDISNQSYVTLTYLDIQQANKRGIYIDNSDYIRMDNLTVANNELMGIEITNTGSSYCTIQESNITNSYLFGIRANGDNHLIQDNTIKNIGSFSDVGLGGVNSDMGGQMGVGIFMRRGPGGNNTVRYNAVEYVGYNGIWYYWNPNILVEYNYIKDACLVLDDGAGIYCFGDKYNPGVEDSDGGIIRYNVIDGVIGTNDGSTKTRRQGCGIYTDEKIRETDVYGNVIANVTEGGIKQHDNTNVTARNNILFNCGMGLDPLNNSRGNHMKSNIVLNTADVEPREVGKQGYLGLVNSAQDAATAIDSNAYYEFHVTNPFRQSNSPYSSLTFAEWQSMISDDANSTFDGTPLNKGEYEKLFYNETKTRKRINLGSTSYRDIYGNTVSGSITLEPFTSKILIKTSSESRSTNQRPSIQNQTFETTGNLTLNEFIGQVVASDPDNGQTLTYSIISGNEDGLFYIDSGTGEIYSSSDVQITQDKLVALTVEATDDDANPLSASATISINITAAKSVITDTTAPTVSSFSIPSTSSTLTISVSSFEASDDQSVARYVLTESSTVPSVDNSGWTTTAPIEYSFAQDGINTLYAWAKDGAGNISASVNKTVEITLPDLSATSSAYLFEESDGNIAVDSECSNDGTIMTEQQRIPGVKNNGIEFTGSGYITMGQCYSVNVQNEVTLSAWIKPDATSTGYQGIIMHGGPSTDTYALYIYPDYQRVAFKTTGTSASWSYKDNISKLWDGNWHHLAVTYDGAEKIAYLDNEVLFKAASTGSIQSGEGYNLLVAAGRDETSPTLLYKGLIDEVRIYNYAISNTEVSKLYDIANTDTVYAEENVNICDGQSYEGWTEPGQYKRTLQSSTGGDSIITTNLYIHATYIITEDITIKEGENYEGWTESGQYQRTLTTVNGCDSLVSTNLTVLETLYTAEVVNICDGESYEGWTESGQYQRNLETAIGADSIVTTNLTVNPTYDITENITIKEGESYEGWTESGQYQKTLTTIYGCDSIVTTNLTVILSTHLTTVYTEEDVEICDGESYEGWTKSGQYQRTLEASTGADSIVTTNLTVHPTNNITEDIIIKEGEIYEGWTETGQYRRTLTSVNGCDSIVTTNLTVLTHSVYSEYKFEEESGTAVIDSKGSNDGTIAGAGRRVKGTSGEGLEFAGSGYVKIGQNFGNIQKEVTLSAWINPADLSGGYQGIIMHGGPNIDTYGLYIYQDAHRIGFKTTGTTSSWTYIDNVITLWDGNWHHLTVTYNGAEKTIYLDNEALIAVTATGTIESGEGYNLYIGAGRDLEPATLTYTGLIDEVRIYNYALSASEISELFNTTSSKQTFYGEEDIFICNGDGYMGWTDSGQYERTLVSSIGGDSIVTTNLTVYPTYNIVEDITINEGDDYEGWTTSGQYVRTLNSQYGCDSMVTTKLTVVSAPSLYSEYLFEENSGSTVFDSKGTVDGTIYNEEIRVNGVNGDGLEFTGSGYIDLGQNYGGLQNEVTLSAWLKPDVSARGNYQGIIMHGGPNIDTYALYIYPNRRGVAFKTTGTTEEWIYMDEINTLWDGNWHLITATYDGKEKVIYLDNTVLFRVAASGKIESGKGYNLYIGAGRDDNKPKLLYQGQIDEVRINNYALTAYEVETLYNGIEGNNTKEGQISTGAGFNDLENKNSFNFYPNPATNFINLDYSYQPEQNTHIQIMDASGRMVYNQKTESLTKRIDINNFPSGIYYIKSVNSKEQIVKKLIKH